MPSSIAICVIGCLHLLFMLCELFPWKNPKIMQLVFKNRPTEPNLSTNSEPSLASVVHNAGIYNGIVAAGLFASAWVGPNAYVIQVTLLAGGIVAGIFGAATLSKPTIGQAILGAIALTVVVCEHL